MLSQYDILMGLWTDAYWISPTFRTFFQDMHLKVVEGQYWMASGLWFESRSRQKLYIEKSHGRVSGHLDRASSQTAVSPGSGSPNSPWTSREVKLCGETKHLRYRLLQSFAAGM